MGPPDRLQFLFQPDYWALPAALLIGVTPRHLNFICVKVGPFGMVLNWGPYMKACAS